MEDNHGEQALYENALQRLSLQGILLRLNLEAAKASPAAAVGSR